MNQEARVPCPTCSELILPNASVCHFCKRPVISKKKGKNAALSLIYSVIIFFALYYCLNEFIWSQAKSDMRRIEAMTYVSPLHHGGY